MVDWLFLLLIRAWIRLGLGPSSFLPRDRGCQKYSHESKSYSNAKFYKIKISAKKKKKIHTYYRILSPNKQALHLGMGGSEETQDWVHKASSGVSLGGCVPRSSCSTTKARATCAGSWRRATGSTGMTAATGGASASSTPSRMTRAQP